MHKQISLVKKIGDFINDILIMFWKATYREREQLTAVQFVVDWVEGITKATEARYKLK